jgi:hypothetical protein
MKFHGRFYHPASRDFDDMPIPGSDDPSFSWHYLHIVFDDTKKNSYVICTNRKQIGNVIAECDFVKRRDKVTHVRDLQHQCAFNPKLTDFAQVTPPTPVPDPRPGIDELHRGLLDYIGATGESINRAVSTELQTLLRTAVRVGQKFPDIDAASFCAFPSRATLTDRFIRMQQGNEKCIFRNYSKHRYCSILMDAGKMHKSPYLCICISNPSTELDPLVISVMKGFNGTLKDYQEAALDAFVKCQLHDVQIVGAVSDHLKAQVSALAHYSEHSVFKKYERMEAKGLRFLGCACHKLNLAVKDFLSDPAAVIAAPIFGDISMQGPVSFQILAEDLKKLSELLNSKSIRAKFDIYCPTFLPNNVDQSD